MEDYFDIAYQMKPCDQCQPGQWPYEYFYFGIFDGHGGHDAASFAKQNLLKFITEQKDFWSENDEDVMRAIRNGFARTHEAMRRVMPNWPKSNRTLPSTAGTTASIIFIKNGKFYTGHVGDSRIVISQENQETKQWISHQLTDDHKPESKQESERIQRAGGEVRNKLGVHRVVWKRPVLDSHFENSLIFLRGRQQADLNKKVRSYPVAESLIESYQTIPFLAIARSLGDFWSINPYSGQYIVSPEPDVACRPIEPNDSCILLATDGLWNVMNSSYAVRIIQELNFLQSSTRSQQKDKYFAVDNFYDVADKADDHAQSLAYIAYQIWERKSLRSDNITVVVAMLHDILSSFHQTRKPHARATRSSLNSSKLLNSFKEQHSTEPVQIEDTNSYLEKITLNRKPKFIVGLPEIFSEKWKMLQIHLRLPPEMGFSHYGLKGRLPRNYSRVNSAICRKIRLPAGYYESCIYVKQVSDDPADSQEMPTRIGKSGKEVRDASAQATQPMHDFGLPWAPPEIDLSQILDFETEEEYIKAFGRLSENETSELEAPEDEEKDDEDDVDRDEVLPDSDSDERSTPKLRCLMNYSPPPRRTTRSSYQSVSENAKRKFQVDSDTTSKSKRRRSQPVHCAV